MCAAEPPAARAPGDAALARRAAEGDRGAFAELMQRHGDATWALALRALGGDEVLAASVVERTWARAWRELPARDDRTSVPTWLLGLTVRSCEDALPRWREEPAVAPVGEPWEAVVRGLAELPWSQRLAWLLVEVHQLAPADAATVLGVPHAVLRELLAAARATLARRVAPDLSPGPP